MNTLDYAIIATAALLVLSIIVLLSGLSLLIWRATLIGCLPV